MSRPAKRNAEPFQTFVGEAGSSEQEALERPWLLLEVTRRCNFRCVYCYSTQSHDDEELTVEQLERILTRVTADVIPRGVTLIGGEPLLVSAVVDLVHCIHARGIVTSISTKGSTLDEPTIRRLKAAGLQAIEISLDTTDPAIYARVTGTPMARMQSKLAELVQSGLFVTVGVMLTRLNLAQLEPLLKLCFALGVKRISLNQLAEVGCGFVNRSIGLTDDELADALDRANVCAQSLGLRVGVGLPVEPCRLNHARYPALEFEACRCGEHKWLIEPNGNVRTCELSPNSVGNTLRDSWSEIVTSVAAQEFRAQKLNGSCSTCEHWPLCRGGCRFRCLEGHAH
ncbi:MAG: radical SAM protein [Myxococcales bacterium]